MAILGEELDGTVPGPPPPAITAPSSSWNRSARKRSGISGSVRLGLAESDEEMEVRVPADSKAVFPAIWHSRNDRRRQIHNRLRLVAQLQRTGAAVI
jgi:hypothetical protein